MGNPNLRQVVWLEIRISFCVGMGMGEAMLEKLAVWGCYSLAATSGLLSALPALLGRPMLVGQQVEAYGSSSHHLSPRFKRHTRACTHRGLEI